MERILHLSEINPFSVLVVDLTSHDLGQLPRGLGAVFRRIQTVAGRLRIINREVLAIRLVLLRLMPLHGI